MNTAKHKWNANDYAKNSSAQESWANELVGIDRSESMIELAKKQFDLPHLSFYTMDATEISTQGKFDVAFSNAALHWVKDHEAVLVGLKKCLNRNAKILFQMGGYGNALVSCHT